MEKSNLLIELIHIEDEKEWRDIIRYIIQEELKLKIDTYISSASIDPLLRLSGFEGSFIIIIDLRLGKSIPDFNGLIWLLDELKGFKNINPQTEIFVLSGELNQATIASLIYSGVPEKHIFDKSDFRDSNNFTKNLKNSYTRLQKRKPQIISKNKPKLKQEITEDSESEIIRILFLSADPTDKSRLRLGEEYREINQKIQLAKFRDKFKLENRMSIRPSDINQALLDFNPQIVHFSGQGTPDGELYFEDQVGKSIPIESDALASLFEQFAAELKCVILNACYSSNQAEAIVKHIFYAIGMSHEIQHKKSIAFTIGFYQALGAGRSFEEAYNLGCSQLRMIGLEEYLMPRFHKNSILR